MNKYVIAIKPMRNTIGEIIPENERTWKFAAIDYFLDNAVGATFENGGYDTVEFDSVEEAEAWWNINKRQLMPVIERFYDKDSLCIQKKNIVIKTETVKGLAM